VPRFSPAAPRAPELGPVGYDASGESGRIHTVVRGDTLWDISEAYLGTPWVWPSIWKDNPDVPNPHRIYPGDKIWISRTSMRRVTDAEAAELLSAQPPAEAVPAATEDAVPVPLGAISVPSIESSGFVSADVLAAAGSIIGSPRPDVLLGQDQLVYLSLGEGQVQKGDRFDVVRVEGQVRDPETGHTLGSYVDQVGWVEVTRVHPESAEAMIRMASEEVQRNDRLVPRVEPDHEIELRMPSSTSVAGQLAFFPNERRVMGGEDYVIINRGTDHGLAVGNPLEVYRSMGQARDPITGSRHMLPDDVIGELVVVSAEPTTAVAMVLHAREELERGDHFRVASQ